ncbi:MAG TPA: D-aminoacyl-tRNA deacylase [Casimicrobiaceae bacterium]|jgi:D-tyrosyl-tRNA(Tyr) deacylase|nr:D-aminoacyl-tRNA deacylase [Casimicrobiaceae bacterium]
MRAVLQRVREARVEVDDDLVAAIGRGLLVLVGVAVDDVPADVDWLARKVVDLRIFADGNGVMNRAVTDVGGEVLAVSQFTLHAQTRKGNRPSWSNAAPPEVAKPLFDAFVDAVSRRLGRPVACGVFGAYMQVALVNDGPVTILLDSREDA